MSSLIILCSRYTIALQENFTPIDILISYQDYSYVQLSIQNQQINLWEK